jgi:dephospho-CoA kinase
MLILGLTGSIGMGKTTTAAMFARRGVPVHDADRAVHRLYADGDAAAEIAVLFPGVAAGGAVDRRLLAAHVRDDPAALARLEAAVHPLVRRSEDAFLAASRDKGARLVVLDIPLLFETGAEARVHAVLVVTADEAVQRARILARPGVDEKTFAALLSRQLPDREKRRRAHFSIDTGRGFAPAERAVDAVLRALAGA